MLFLARPVAGDILISATPEDIQPGSRLSSLAATECKYFLFCGGVKKLYFSPTFHPI